MGRYLIFILLTAITSGFAQQKKIATIEISSFQSASVDRPGDLYLFQKKSVKKITQRGTPVEEIQLDDSPTVFEPRDGARMFQFSAKTQQCSFFSAGTKQEFKIEAHYAVEPVLACTSGDHQVWVLDKSDWSVKRVNPAKGVVVVEAQIDQKQFTSTPEFYGMREYQNFLFLIERTTGILIFNSLGNQIKKIEVTGIDYINFLGEELYYKKNDQLIFCDLFDAATRTMPVDPACRYALITDTRTYLVYSKKVDILENQ
jgi:hypothetical protein